VAYESSTTVGQVLLHAGNALACTPATKHGGSSFDDGLLEQTHPTLLAAAYMKACILLVYVRAQVRMRQQHAIGKLSGWTA
jgi:hypothetical protein